MTAVKMLWGPAAIGAANITNGALGTASLNDADNAVGWTFNVPRDGTITDVGFLVTAHTGTLTITAPAANGVFSWQPDPADVAIAGAHQVQFEAVFGTEPDPARTIVFDWEIAESIVPAA